MRWGMGSLALTFDISAGDDFVARRRILSEIYLLESESKLFLSLIVELYGN